jgi:predicted Zn-dependent peptidase
VESEIGIIAEEIRMYDDNPGDRCFYGMLEGMYREHSIRKNICGSEASIKRITAKTLYDCYGAFYRPDNMVLAICGDVDAEHVIEVIDRHLPEHFAGKSATKINDNDKELPSVLDEYVESRMPVAKPIFNIGFKDTDIPADATERQRKDAVMAILNEMLFSRSGEFYSSLFEQNLISPAMSYGYTISETFAYNSIAGEADDPKLILSLTRDHIEKVKKSGLDRSEFERAKKVMYSEFIRLFDSTENIANTLFSFCSEGAELFEYADILAQVSFEDVVLCFDRFFSHPAICLSVIRPL